MKWKYITYNDRLTSKLNNLGFKRKNMNSFVKYDNDARQELFFCHATHYEHHVRYYSIGVHIEYPALIKLATEMDTYTYGIGVDLGYLMPQNEYHEWRCTENDSERTLTKIADDMILNVTKYAIPFFNRFSTLNSFMKGLEGEELRNRTNCKYSLPFVYLALGDKERALEYIQEILKMLQDTPKEPVTEIINKPDQVIIQFTPNKEFVVFSTFADKFFQYVKMIGVLNDPK